jgi:hypothetical protein
VRKAKIFGHSKLRIQHERNDPGGADLAEIWRNAHRRRIQDFRAWLANFFEKCRQLTSPDARPQSEGILCRLLNLRARTFLPSSGADSPPKGDEIGGGRSGQ